MSDDLRRKVGQEGEQAAYEFLVNKGFFCRERNYRLRGGEIDLIMEDGNHLVFVEVKRRQSAEYGVAAEAVTPSKMRRMTKTALTYIAQRKLTERMVRFDVVTIDASGIHHIPNAFEVTGNYYF